MFGVGPTLTNYWLNTCGHVITFGNVSLGMFLISRRIFSFSWSRVRGLGFPYILSLRYPHKKKSGGEKIRWIRWPLNGVVERDKTAFEFIDALFKESFAKISTVVEILAKDSLNSAYMKVSFGRKATNWFFGTSNNSLPYHIHRIFTATRSLPATTTLVKITNCSLIGKFCNSEFDGSKVWRITHVNTKLSTIKTLYLLYTFYLKLKFNFCPFF